MLIIPCYVGVEVSIVRVFPRVISGPLGSRKNFVAALNWDAS